CPRAPDRRIGRPGAGHAAARNGAARCPQGRGNALHRRRHGYCPLRRALKRPGGRMMDSEIVWTPSEAQKKASAMWAFSKRAGFEGDYPALLDWSIREPEAFHALLWDALGIVGDRG